MGRRSAFRDTCLARTAQRRTKAGMTAFSTAIGWTKPPSDRGPSPSLAASVSDGLISLTLSGYDHDWWFSIYQNGVWERCERVSGASAEVRGYGKPRFWTTFIDASSDSGCVSSIAYTYLDMPMTSLSASVNDANEVSLTLSNFAGDWWHSIDGGDCVRATERTVGGITDYPRRRARRKGLRKRIGLRARGKTNLARRRSICSFPACRRRQAAARWTSRCPTSRWAGGSG